MQNRIKLMTAKVKQRRTQKIKTYMMFSALAVLVGAGTLWALIRPASTMSGKVICGMEEHTHTEECYGEALVCQEKEEGHAHTEECWVRELICSQPQHTHAAECYGASEPAPAPEEIPPVMPQEQDTPDAVEDGTAPQADGNAHSEAEPEHTPAVQPLLDQRLRRDVPEEFSDYRTVQLPEGGSVSVYAQPGVLSEGIELRARILDAAEAAFAQAEQRVQTAGVAYDYINALDIALYNQEGEEVEPQGAVYVVIDFGPWLSEGAIRESVRVQHHKEILPPVSEDDLRIQAVSAAAEPEIQVESVMDDTNGVLDRDYEQDSCMATFTVDSFSVFTITSLGWTGDHPLNIKVQCVDEYGVDLEVKPEDIVKEANYTPASSFDLLFMTRNSIVPTIDRFRYDGKAYYMVDGEYQARIYGLRWENGSWYYYTKKDDVNARTKFDPQPDFYGENPRGTIRLIYKKELQVPVRYVTLDHTPLGPQDAPGGRNPGVVTVFGRELDVHDVEQIPKSNTYFYTGRAYAGEPIPENEVVKVIRAEGQLFGETPEGKKIPLSEENPLNLLFQIIQTGDNPTTIQTVPTREAGLTINLFDYNSGNSRHATEKINVGKKLHFGPRIVENGFVPQPFNRWTGADGGIYTGIVDQTLDANGYPSIQGESLDYLFDPELCKAEMAKDPSVRNIDHVHTNLDHLFWRDKDGYYRYDSMTNFATVVGSGTAPSEPGGCTDNGNFIVYSQPAMPGLRGDEPKFLPFNTYAQANRPSPDFGAASDKQYHFGMTMATDFVMPPGGVVPDADGDHTGLRDMVFRFNGDDDVWVFIDGKLALDLGGIHGRYGGTINFRTGEVSTNAPPTEHGGRHQKNIYGIEGDPELLTSEELAAKRAEAGFGSFSEHNLKFFYLERGMGASNCEIVFNLIPVTHTLVVGKKLPVESFASPTSHMRYRFRAEVQQPGGQRVPLANTGYSIVEWTPDRDPATGGLPVGVGRTDEEGYFWLKAGQRADFIDVIPLDKAGTVDSSKVKIYISEILPNTGAVRTVQAWNGDSDKVGSYVESVGPDGLTRKVIPPLFDADGHLYHTEANQTTLTRTEREGQIIHEGVMLSGRDNEFNWIDFENDLGDLADLNITKQALHTDGITSIPGVPFTVQVELWDEETDGWILLPGGSPYWILNPGEVPTKDQIQRLDANANGRLSIVDGQTIHLHLLAGTKYRVTEVLSPEETAVYTTEYKGETTPTEELEWYREGDRVTGIGNKTGIAAGSAHNITIVNTGDPLLTPNGSFALTKAVTGDVLPPPDTAFDFQLLLQNYATGGADGAYQPELVCNVTYFHTPEGARSELGAPQNGMLKGTVTFTPQNTSGGTAGAPDRGEAYTSNLFLYPGETAVITGLPVGSSLHVKEVFSEEESGNYQVSFQEEGKEAVSGTEIGSLTPIYPEGAVKVTCTNQSNLLGTSTLEIQKTVKRTDQPDGAPTAEDLEKRFEFSITLKRPVGFSGGDFPAEIRAADGTAVPQTLTFAASGEDYVASGVFLKHGETLSLPGLPTGVDVVVQEHGHDGYSVSMNQNPGDKITVFLKANSGKPYLVSCVNMTGVELPDTGGHGRMPYALFGTALMLCAAGLLLYRRKGKRSAA